MAKRQRIEYVKLDHALNGHLDPLELNKKTRAEYDKVIEAGPVEPGEGSDADFVADEFWAGVRECEAAVGAKADEVGDGTPEHDQFVADLRALGGT